VTDERFLAWPGRRHLALAARLTLLVSVLFCIVYGGANYVTAQRSQHVTLVLPAELAIPLWPPAMLVYDSLYLLFFLAPFVLRTEEAFRRLALAASATIVVSGVCFLLIPARLAFSPPHVTGALRTIFELSDRINLDYNLVPSLHVGLATICLLAYWPRATPLVRTGLATWGTALALSTLLTHQHHLLDVVTGAALAWAMCRVDLTAFLLTGRRKSYAE
jgi:membrane-associated phospholipid phosphatase